MPTTLRLCGVCGGDTLNLLGMETPHLPAFLEEIQLTIRHPSLSYGVRDSYEVLLTGFAAAHPLDLLLVEGVYLRRAGHHSRLRHLSERTKKRPYRRIEAGVINTFWEYIPRLQYT